MPRAARAAVIILILIASARPAPAGQQPPVFRSGVDLVTVDATVVDDRGRPVDGLGRDDFRLEVDGRPRRLVSVQFVSRGASMRAVERPATAPTDVSSNEFANDGRLVLVAVDQANIRRLEGRAALRAAGRFLDTLSPWDRVAVAPVNYAGDLEFTTDHAKVRRELEMLAGEADPAFVQFTFNIGLAEALEIADGQRVRLERAIRRECGSASPQQRVEDPTRAAEQQTMRDICPTQVEQEARAMAQHIRTRASLSLSDLMGLLETLKTVDGPKAMVLLSEGLIAEPQLVDLTALGVAAQEARVTIYVLQLEALLFDASDDRVSPTLFEDTQLRADGLARLAGAAKGALFRLVGGDPEPFQRITRELSGYYLLAFEPGESDRDGKVHRIRVSLTRGGGTLRARPAFRFESTPRALSLTEERLVGLLRSGGVATELPLRVATYAYYEPASGDVRVVIGGETDATDGPPEVLFGFVLLDGRGVIVASQVEETASRRFATAAVVAPGVYTLKVAAIDRFGRPGSIPRAVLAGIGDSPVPTSELMVARIPARADAPLDPIVEMTRDDRVLAYLELYPDQGRSLAETDVTLSVRPAEGRAALLTMLAAVSTRDARLGVARAMVPIQNLPNGRYIMRAEVSDKGSVVGQVERAFTIAR